MAVEDWIDAICALWEIDDGGGGTVRSYRVYERDEFPESLVEFPCALTYTTGVEHLYSLGGPLIDRWTGRTEFHLTPDVGKQNYPALMLFFARIRNAAAGSLTLGGLVSHFGLGSGTGSAGETGPGVGVQGPVVLQYGSEEPHLGLVVNWVVKEIVSGDFTPAE